MRSMTGFGTGRVEHNGDYVRVEIASVNNRHSQVQIKLDQHPAVEQQISKHIKQTVDRGKIDVTLESNLLGDTGNDVQLNGDLIDQYLEHARAISQQHEEVPATVQPGRLMSLPEAIQVQSKSPDEDYLQGLLIKALDDAMDELIEMRSREGEQIRQDLADRIDEIRDLVSTIADRVPEALDRYRDQLEEKMQEFLELPDTEMQERMENEIKMYADKCDISEELVRIQSHLDQFRDYLEADEPVGKNLEFLTQELQREINTVGAKANDAQISQLAVEVKTALEKCREQINNVE